MWPCRPGSIGMKTIHSKRDKLTVSVVGGAVGAVVCTPPYLLGRVGLLMLGSHALFIPGVIILAIGLTLQAVLTGAVKAIKMSAKLVAGNRPASSPDGRVDDPARMISPVRGDVPASFSARRWCRH